MTVYIEYEIEDDEVLDYDVDRYDDDNEERHRISLDAVSCEGVVEDNKHGQN